MALELPGWLVEAIRYIGYEFPQTNEDVLHQWADSLRSLEGTISSSNGDLESAVANLGSNNQGPTIDAVIAKLRSDESNLQCLREYGEAAGLGAAGCDLLAHAVVVMKGVVLFQLALLAPAIAGGPVSFLLKKGVEWAIDRAVDYAIGYFLGGE